MFESNQRAGASCAGPAPVLNRRLEMNKIGSSSSEFNICAKVNKIVDWINNRERQNRKLQIEINQHNEQFREDHPDWDEPEGEINDD